MLRRFGRDRRGGRKGSRGGRKVGRWRGVGRRRSRAPAWRSRSTPAKRVQFPGGACRARKAGRATVLQWQSSARRSASK